MNQRIYRSITEPIRKGLSQEELWRDTDKGLIRCWETGRELREDKPELAKRAENGELPKLNWKGGVDEDTKLIKKYGTLFYLAQWQGLSGDDLDIDPSQEPEIVCSKAGTRVIFTSDPAKYAPPDEDEPNLWD